MLREWHKNAGLFIGSFLRPKLKSQHAERARERVITHFKHIDNNPMEERKAGPLPAQNDGDRGITTNALANI